MRGDAGVRGCGRGGGRPGPCGTEGGQGLIELALALPILLAVVSAIIDGGWAFHQAGMAAAAAQAAERAVAIQDTGAGNCAGAPPASYTQTAQAAAQAAAPDLDPAKLAITVGYLDAACAGRMRTLSVSVTYPLAALTPWFTGLLDGRHVTAQAAAAVEELPPPWWAQGAQMAAQQAQIQAQQAEIASLTAAYQAEAAQVASLSAAASAYGSQVQNAGTASGASGPDH